MCIHYTKKISTLHKTKCNPKRGRKCVVYFPGKLGKLYIKCQERSRVGENSGRRAVRRRKTRVFAISSSHVLAKNWSLNCNLYHHLKESASNKQDVSNYCHIIPYFIFRRNNSYRYVILFILLYYILILFYL